MNDRARLEDAALAWLLIDGSHADASRLEAWQAEQKRRPGTPLAEVARASIASDVLESLVNEARARVRPCRICGKKLVVEAGGGSVPCPTCGIASASGATAVVPFPSSYKAAAISLSSSTLPPAAAPSSLTARPPELGTYAAGAKLHRWTIERELGRGGMGLVLLAREGDRHLAVKLIAAEASEHQRKRFLREARATSKLDHPGIVKIVDVGECAAGPYIAMELIDGAPLYELQREGLLPSRSMELLEEVARAVGHAHSRKVIHRDLKPANILVTKEGRAKVVDFGLAKDLDATTQLTKTGTLLGTPHYMSPEAVKGPVSQVGPATDTWAIGVILYELTTGYVPFDGQNAYEVCKAILTAHVEPPTKKRPDVGLPAELDRVIARALARDPAERYATAEDLADDLARVRRGEQAQLGPRPSRLIPRLAVAAGVVALAAVATFVARGYRDWVETQELGVWTHRAMQLEKVVSKAESDLDADRSDVAERDLAAAIGSFGEPPIPRARDALAKARATLERARARETDLKEACAALEAGKPADAAKELDRRSGGAPLAKAIAGVKDERWLLARATAALALGDEESEKLILDRAVTIAPTSVAPRAALVRRALRLGDVERARGESSALESIARDDPTSRVLRARVLDLDLDLDGATREARAAVIAARAKNDRAALLEALLLVARLAETAEKPDEALASLNDAARALPDRAEPLARRARIEARLGRSTEAAKDVGAALALAPASTESLRAAADVALSELLAALVSPDEPKGRALVSDALRSIDEACRLEPSDDEAFVLRARLLARAADPRARDALALAHAKPDAGARKRWFEVARRGRKAFEDRGDPSELELARKACRRLLAERPHHARALGELGAIEFVEARALILARRPEASAKADAALARLEQVTTIDELCWEPWFYRGQLLLMLGRSPADAARELERALELAGEGAWQLMWVARARLACGDLDRARSAAERATELDPRLGNVWNTLADVLDAKGDHAKAEEARRRDIWQRR